MAVLIFLGCLLGGIAIGLPIAWALLLCGAALMFWLDMFDVQIMAQTLVNGADSFSLLAIPFFVLAGEIMNAGGLSKRIVDLPMKLVGHKPGGLGYVGVLAAMIMASLSGSAVADTAAVAALSFRWLEWCFQFCKQCGVQLGTSLFGRWRLYRYVQYDKQLL